MNFTKLDRYLDQLVFLHGIPFCDVAVMQDGKSIYRHGAGFTDMEHTKPVAGNELMWLYSTSKVITCFAAMRLIGEGKLSLADPVSKYIPSFANITVRQPDGSVRPAKNIITVEHLFTMTGGLSYNFTSPLFNEARENLYGTVRYVSEFPKEPLAFEPGTDYRYSLCHDVLAAVVEVVSGMRFSEYLKTYFFNPLGIENIGFHPTEEQKKRFAGAFWYNSGTLDHTEHPCESNYDFNPNYESGGGGMFASVDEYIKIISAAACGGKAPDGYRIFDEKCIPMMQVNRLCPKALNHFVTYRFHGYGWGLCGRVHTNPAVSDSLSPAGEFGWDGAAATYALIDTENRLAFFFGTQMFGGTYLYAVGHQKTRNLIYECLKQ